MKPNDDFKKKLFRPASPRLESHTSGSRFSEEGGEFSLEEASSPADYKLYSPGVEINEGMQDLAVGVLMAMLSWKSSCVAQVWMSIVKQLVLSLTIGLILVTKTMELHFQNYQ